MVGPGSLSTRFCEAVLRCMELTTRNPQPSLQYRPCCLIQDRRERSQNPTATGRTSGRASVQGQGQALYGKLRRGALPRLVSSWSRPCRSRQCGSPAKSPWPSIPHHDTKSPGWWFGKNVIAERGIKRAPFVWRRAIGSGFLS
jgi:hypothetical protein